MLQRNGLVKLRRVLRAIRKHFPQPPDDVLAGYAIDKFLDDPNLCEDKLSEEAGSDGFLDSIMKIIFPEGESHKQLKASSLGRYKSISQNITVIFVLVFIRNDALFNRLLVCYYYERTIFLHCYQLIAALNHIRRFIATCITSLHSLRK